MHNGEKTVSLVFGKLHSCMEKNEIRKIFNTPKLILRGHHHPDTKTRQRCHKKRKLQANITDEHRYKNRQQNTSKQNPTAHQKDHTPGFPGGAVVKNLPAFARDTGSSPDPGRSPMTQSN